MLIKKMKKLAFLMATLLIGSIMFTSCKKDSDTTGNSIKVSYALNDKTLVLGEELIVSNCFKFDVTYTGADGKSVEVKGVSLPWTSNVFEVKSPFKAKIEAKPVYVESELPDIFIYGLVVLINKNGTGFKRHEDMRNWTKTKFLQKAQDSPDELIMKTEYDF